MENINGEMNFVVNLFYFFVYLRPARKNLVILKMNEFANFGEILHRGYMQKIKCFFLFLVIIQLTTLSANQPASVTHKPPILTTTTIIEVFDQGKFQGIVLIERGKAPWGKALPGGKVEYGETVETAVRREMMEEVNLELQELQQFYVLFLAHT